MGILELLRGTGSAASSEAAETDTVRRIVARLDQLDPARARFLAAFAYVLGRVAAADLQVSEVETTTIVDILQRLGHLDESQALLIVEIAKTQNRLFGGTEDFLVTREFREVATDEERRRLLDCLFAVSAADDAILPEEEGQIRQIASELGFEHAEYVQALLPYTPKRSVFRHFRKSDAER